MWFDLYSLLRREQIVASRSSSSCEQRHQPAIPWAHARIKRKKDPFVNQTVEMRRRLPILHINTISTSQRVFSFCYVLAFFDFAYSHLLSSMVNSMSLTDGTEAAHHGDAVSPRAISQVSPTHDGQVVPREGTTMQRTIPEATAPERTSRPQRSEASQNAGARSSVSDILRVYKACLSAFVNSTSILFPSESEEFRANVVRSILRASSQPTSRGSATFLEHAQRMRIKAAERIIWAERVLQLPQVPAYLPDYLSNVVPKDMIDMRIVLEITEETLVRLNALNTISLDHTPDETPYLTHASNSHVTYVYGRGTYSRQHLERALLGSNSSLPPRRMYRWDSA